MERENSNLMQGVRLLDLFQFSVVLLKFHT